jgi:hypothetical protein
MKEYDKLYTADIRYPRSDVSFLHGKGYADLVMRQASIAYSRQLVQPPLFHPGHCMPQGGISQEKPVCPGAGILMRGRRQI